MPPDIKVGTALIHSATFIPEPLRVKAEAYSHDWEMINGTDGDTLDHNLREIGWNFFFLADTIHSTGWGSWGERTVRKAVERVLAQARSSRFNCMEITEVAAKRFLGFPYVRVSAHSRHIQKGPFLQSLAERRQAETTS